MFTKGDVAIFSAGVAVLDALWNSDIKEIQEIRNGILNGAKRHHVREAMIKIAMILMIDAEEEEQEEKPQAKPKVKKTVQEGKDGFNIVFSEE